MNADYRDGLPAAVLAEIRYLQNRKVLIDAAITSLERYQAFILDSKRKPSHRRRARGKSMTTAAAAGGAA